MANKSPSAVKQLKKNASRKPKVETNKQKLGKRQGYLYNVGKSITYVAVEKMKQMNPVISDFSDTNNDLFKTIYKSAMDYRTTYRRGLDAIMKTKFYEAADVGLRALKEDIMTGNLYNKERLEKMEMKQMGLSDDMGSGFDDNLSADLGDLSLDDWGDDFSDFDDNWDDEPTDSSSSGSKTSGTAQETLATISSIENTSQANANAISMAVARSAEYSSKVNIKNTNLLYTQNTKAFGIMNGHLDAMNSNIGSVMQYLDKNLTPHLSNSTEFFTNTSKALQDQVSLLREIAENTRKIEATTNSEEGKKNKIGYNDVVDAGGMPDLVAYGKTIMKNSNSYLNELTGGAWNMMMQGTGENSNMLALFAANPYGALLSSMINRMTPKDLEKAFNNMNKTIGGFFASMVTKLNTMSNSEDSMLDKMLGKVFGIKNTPKSSVDVSQYDKGKVDWNGKSQKALTEVIPQQLSKILSALTGSQETTFNYETGKFVTYDEMKREFDNMKNSFWKSAASEPMQQVREIANKNLAFGSKEEYDQFFKDLEKLFETSYNKGEIIDYQKNNFNEKYLDYGVSEKNLLAIQSILRELPRNIMMQYNADMQDQYTNQTRRFKDIEKSGQYAYLFNNANHNQFAKELNGKKNKKAEKTSFNTNLLLDTKDNYGKNIFFYMQSMYKELNYMRRITAQGFGGGGNIQGMPLDLVQNYDIVDADGNTYTQRYDRGFRSLSETAIKDTRSENEKMSESTKKALERDRANKTFLRQQARRLEKGELLVNISDLDDETVRGAVRSNVQTNKNKDKLREEAEKEKTEFDKLKEEMGLSGKSFSSKFDKFAEKAQKYIKRPSSIMTDLAVKVDQGLFELIYGKEGENGKKSIKGILDHLLFEMKKSFNHFNEFMDEKILNPLKDRLGLDKDKGLIKGIYGKLSEMFGLEEKKKGAKDFFKQVREKMTDTLKGIGTSITDSVKDVFSPLTNLFKSKNFFDKKKEDNNQEEFDEDDITTTVTKILRNYDFDNYDNLNGKQKFDKTKRSIEHARKVQSGESNNINEMFDMNNIKLELKELDEETKNLKDIKEYRSLNMSVMTLRQQIRSVTKDLNDYNNQYLALRRSRNKQQQIKAKKVKAEIKKCKDTIAKLNDRLDKAMKRLKEMRDSNQNIEQELLDYDNARENIINKNNFNKYDIGQRQNVLNEQAYEYFQSSEFKNLPIEEQRRLAEEMLTGKDKNVVDQLKKSQDRLKELEKQNGTEIGRFRNFNGVTKDGKKNGMRKVNTELLQKIEKQKIDKLTKQIEQSIRSNDMSLPALRYLATLDNRYQGLLSEVSLNGESEDLNKQIAEVEKMIETGESNLNKNDPRSIAGLDLQYDKTAKQKLLDSFAGILGNEDGDMYDFVSKSIDKLFKDRDSNYADNFEGITIKDILGQKDSVIKDISDKKDAAIRAKQKIYNKKGAGYKMSENAPANKRINELSKQIEDAENTFNELAKFITNSLGLKEDGTLDTGNGVEDIEALDAFDRIKKYNQSKVRPEDQQDKDRPWSDNLTEGGSKFITDNKFIKESMKTQTSTTESIDSTLKQILNLLQGNGNKNQFKPGPRLTPFMQNPLRNIEAGNEQAVLNDFMDGLTTDIQNAVKGYFGRVGIPGFAKGGVIDKDQLAIVGKGETVVPSLTGDKRNQIANQIREAMGKVQSGKWKDNKVHEQAKYLYQNIAAVMGADNVDPNIIISMLGRSGEVGNDFANLDNEDQQKHFVKIVKITQQALNQRNEGVINNSGNQTDKGVAGDYTNIFSETFQVYKRAINKTMEAIVGDKDGKKDKKVSANAMKEVMGEAKLYGPDVVSGALLGGGASLLTGFIGGPLLGAAVGSGIALTKNSAKVQAMLFGEKEFDKDGNYIGRKGGLLPKDFVNTVAKTFPDMKKYGIVGLLSGFTALNPLGPVPGLLIGSALGVAKNNATIQNRLFGETGIIGEDRWNKFKKNLPNILAGAGVGFGLNMLHLSGPFGVLGSILIGSALGYASTTDKFKEMIFGTYNPQTGEQEGGLIGFMKDKIFSPFINWAKRDILKPLKDAFKPITKQIGIMFKTVFGGIAKGVINFFNKTLVVPIKEKVGKFLSTIFSPFKNLGKRLLGTVGRIISTPARILGGIGRATQRHQIRVGTADDMTAEERLNYMNNQNEMDFFYDQSQKIKRDSFNNAAEEMEKRFGKKDANKLRFLMRTGFHDQAQDLIKKRFGDVKDEESKKVMQNMLKDTSNYKKYYGSRILRDTYYERKEAADNVKNQVDEQFEAYKKANPDSKVTREEYLQNIYGDKYNKKVKDNGYNNDEADKILASMTNDQLGEFVNQYKAFGVTDKEYEKNKIKAGKEITALLKNMNIGANGKLKIKDRNIILGGLNYGQSEMAINYLRKLAKDQGIKLDDNADFNKIMDLMNEFKITEDLRLDKEKGKNAYERKVKELAGNSTKLGKELSLETFGKLAISEDRLRNLKGKVITPEDIKDDERNKKITEIIKGITDLNKSLTDKQDETNKLLEQIRDFKTGDEFQQRRANSKIELDDAVHRDEQVLSLDQKKRQILLRRIGIKSLDDQPDFVRKMPLADLQTYVKKYRTVSYKDIMKQYREEAEAKKAKEDEVKKTGEEEAKKQQDETAVEKIKKSVDTSEVKDGLSDDMKKSILDAEGNEVVMKRDSKTGQYETDSTDSSTRKSIRIAQRLREKQEAFYDSFSGLFKKNEKEEDEEKKSGGWLSKLLMALGIGKGLLGRAKGLLGGILGRGAIGGLFTRGIFGTIGKGALVIGGLMYLPEIIDLFKTKIGPAISENWDTTIKPWLTEEALPRLKDGLVLLVQEIPSLLKGTVKFIGSELIPSILKGMGWDIGTDKDNQEVTYDENGNPVNKGGKGTTSAAAVIGNTAVRSTVRKGARYASAVKTSVAKNIAKEGEVKTLTKSLSKEGVEEITEGAVKSGFKGGAKDIARAGFKTAKDFILHPVKTSVKGAVKGAKTVTNAGGKILGNKFLKMDAKRIAKRGGLSNKMEGKILTNVANSGLVSQLLNWAKNQFTKLFTNSTVVNLLGKVKNIPVAKALLERAVPKMLEVISKGAVKMSGTALARVVGGIGTGGLVTLGFAVYDFISGFKDARNIMGITEDNVPFGYRIISGVVKTIQGLSIIATLLPTKTIMSILINVLSGIGVDMGNIKQQQEKAQQELKEYNEKNGTNFSLEEYNKEVKGHKGLFDRAKDTVKWAGGKISETGKWIGNGAKNLGGKAVKGLQWLDQATLKGIGKWVDVNKWVGSKALEGLKWVNDNGINWAGDKMAGALTAMGNGAGQLWNGAKWLGNQAINGIGAGGKMLENGFNTAKNWTGNMLLSGVKGGANLMAKGLTAAANGIVDTPKMIGSLYNSISDWGKGILDGLTKQLSGWYDKNIKPVLDGIGKKFNDIKDWCSKFIQDPIKAIGEGFQSLLDWFKNKFGWVIKSKDWVSDKWNDAKSAAGNAWDTVKNGVKNVFTKKPSKDTNAKVSDIKTVNGMKVGKGEGDVVNGNPYFSQKQASGQFGQMINDAGCGPTSTAMALSKVTGKDISPESIAKDAYKNKTWDSEGARGNMFASEAKKYGVKTVSSGGNFEKFDKMVSAGIPTAVSGTLGKGEDSPYTKAGHIVTVFGKDKNGNYLVNDPRGKKYSKAYSKEELMNGFRDSWSFGKGDDDSSNSVPSSERVIGNVRNTIKSVAPSALSSSFRKKSTLALNHITKSVSGTGMIESASKVLEEIFTKIFNNDTIINLLGDASSSQYSAASVLLGNFVPQVIKKLKMNCEKNKSINLNRYLRAIVSNANVSNISFLISNFVNAFNNPAKYIGNYDTYTTGMKTCAAILATINERFVIDKLLPSTDWAKLIQDYVMPVFGEGPQDIDTLKKQADKIVKEFNLKSMSTNATTDTITSIAENLTGSTSASGGILNKIKNGAQSLFSKVTGGVSNVVHNVASGVKSVVKKAGNAVGNVYNTVKNAVASGLNWFGGLFGKGEYVGKGKDPAEVSQTDDSYLGVNNFPYFSQYKDYNTDKKKPELSETGCGPTSAAMVLSKVTGKMITPNEVADETYNAGVYDDNGSTDSMFPYLGNKYGIKVKSIDNFEQIKQYASRGVPMVISGEGGNLYGTDSDGHIVAMFGRNKNGYIVNDPSSINGSKSYDESQLKKGFKHAWVFGDTGYKEDIKDAEQVMLSSKDSKALALEDPNFAGKGSDPTTLTYVNGFPYWSQVAFGGNILKAGCGPTSAAMAFGQVTGKTLNPKDMCAQGKSHGWSPTAGVTDSSRLFNYYGKKYNTSVTYISSLSKTKELAAKGYPLIIDGRCSKSSNWSKNCLLTPYGPNGHYLALFGKTKDGYVINDPRGSRFSGARSESQLSTGFRFAFKIGDKTYKVDESKVKKVGSTDGQESSGSSSEGVSEDTGAEATGSNGDDFFGDMATAAINFGKKLFGFDIDTANAETTSSSSSGSPGSECTRYTGTNYKAGQSVKASFTAYYPHNDSMEGGFYDCKGNPLNPAEQTCAAPADVPVGTKIKISNTGTSLDGKIYTVTDRGGAIKIVNGVYRIDILVSASDYKNFQNCKGNITFMGKDGSAGKGPDIVDLTNPYYGMGEGVDWGYFCDPSKGSITSYFSEKRSQYATARGDHGALDYNVHFQPLYAPKSGTVYSENEHSSYGNSLTIKTNSGNTFYRVAHMKSKKVKKGDSVKQGQLLGISGATGHVSGPHVHLEVLKGGTSKSRNGVDPLNYYTETKGKHYKLKGSSLSFKEYMDKVGGEITEVNDGSDGTSDATSDGTATEDTTATTTAGDFFGDMATAAINFTKKLFGFNIDTPAASDATTDDSSSSEYGSSSSDESNISAKNVAEKILKFTKAKGASDAASAGVLGNAWCESSFNPKADGKDKTGTYFGLFQWIRKYNNFDKLKKIAKSMNLEWSDTDAQMAFLWDQLQDSTHKVWLNQEYPKKGLNGFLNETDAYQAGSKFNKFFERGVGGGTRAKTAQTIYKKYLKDGKLVNFENFVSTGKGDDERYGKGDDKVKLSSKIIEYALSFLNKGFYYSQPNRDYINKNRNASDCSSFTHHVFDRAAGTEIGGYTEQQYLSSRGTKVKKGDLKPGDIILFKNTRSSRNGTTKYKDNVSHSSLYLGDNKYIESTTSDSSGFSGIRVANLGSSWSQNHWLTGKRFVDGDKKVSPTIKNPNKLTKFEKATGSYTLPEASVGNYSASHGGASSGGDDTSTGSTAGEFFSDMATAAINFSKKLFGFDIDTPAASDATTDSSSSSDGSDLSSGTDYSSVKTKVSSSDFDKSVILGDSIAKGFKDMKVLPSSRVVATIGDTVAKGISDGNVAKAAAKKPPVIITHYGTNDADWISGGGSFNADWYSKQYTKLINKIKKESPKSKIVLTQTFTPSGGKTKKWVPVVQKALPGIASKNSVNIVDSRSIDKPSYRGSDHIHPISKEFYTKWLADIKSKITSEGKGEDTDLTKDIDSYFQDTLDGVKSSDFGIRDNEFHTGVDYAAKENTPIKSPVSGKVVENLKDKKYGFGNTLVVRDKKGIDHRFAHMKDQSSYGLGTKVRQNDIIGNVGSTGRSTGSHLHYEVTDNGKSLNPSKYYDKTAHGGTKNSLDKVTLSFPDSDQKVDANISNLNKGIDEKVLKQLITIIVSVLNKVANNTENIKEVVDLLTEIQKSITGKPATKTKTTKPTTKTSSDTDKTKTQKIFSLLQKGMNSTDSDTSNTQAILDILEILATE